MALTMSHPVAGAILLAEHNPRWPAMFAEERALLQSSIDEWAVAIEHVGSTAIPGIAAKPVIDIGVALNQFTDALYCITPLVETGWVCMGEFGIPGRIFFRKVTDAPQPGQSPNGVGRTHQIHMYARDHEQFINHLALRDYLRADADARQEYEDLKRRLAEEHSDVEAYADSKTIFVRDVLARARATGLEVAG